MAFSGLPLYSQNPFSSCQIFPRWGFVCSRFQWSIKLQIDLDAENRSDSDAKDMTKIILDMQSNLMTRQLISDAVNKGETIGLAGRLEFSLPGQSRLP